MKTVIDIVREYLEANGFDGLYNSEQDCGCELSDLAPCCEIGEDCAAGYKFPCDCGEHDFHIGSAEERDRVLWELKETQNATPPKQKLMAEGRLTVNQADILLHALGHPKYYRNYFAVSGGTQDWRDIQILVEAGFMEGYSSRDLESGLLYYRVTEDGMERMREAGFELAPTENECGEGADYSHETSKN